MSLVMTAVLKTVCAYHLSIHSMYPKSNDYGTAVRATASSVEVSGGMFPTENAHPPP